jgi:hypothetical protein
VFVEKLEKKEDLGNIAGWERKREGRQIFKCLKAFVKPYGSRRNIHLPGEIVAPRRLESLR